MKSFRSRYVRRVLVPVMAATLLSACHTWKVQELTPSRVVAAKEPSEIRLTMLDGEKVRLSDPSVSGGVIMGHPVRGWGVVRSDTLRLAADSVARIEIWEIDETATVVVVVVGLGTAAMFALMLATWEGPDLLRGWCPRTGCR